MEDFLKPLGFYRAKARERFLKLQRIHRGRLEQLCMKIIDDTEEDWE